MQALNIWGLPAPGPSLVFRNRDASMAERPSIPQAGAGMTPKAPTAPQVRLWTRGGEAFGLWQHLRRVRCPKGPAITLFLGIGASA